MTDLQKPAGGGPVGNKRVLLWFRRDLRLADNPALVAALRMAPEVVPVYIWSPEEEGQFQPGRCSRWWLFHSLAALQADLAALGSRLLCFRAADSGARLAQLAREMGAGAVVFNHLYDPISMVRDNEVKAGLAAQGIFCQSFNADVLREPWEVLDAAGKPFTCFDGFWAAHSALPYPPSPPLPLPGAMPAVPEAAAAACSGCLELGGLGIMTPEEEMSNAQLQYQWQPGSAGAHRVLDDFVRSGRLKAFDADRAKTDRASTSRLSPHIHYGEVSVRHMHYVAKSQQLDWARLGESGASVSHFLRQLGYREYSRYLSFHFPFTHERSLLEHLRAVPWRFDQSLFKAWRQGRTGYPLVDAAMREVWGTGWMHNRMRVVAASFLVKDLLLPWQWGLKHYWDALLDADLECDALGWQYVAGCMADAQEFGSSIDQGSEAKRFDPEGHYVRRWLPVLARLPAKYIHQPWLAPESVLADAGVELGANYPFPVISQEESAAALAAATAVVAQCQRGGSSAAAGVAASTGPFRPATAAEPAEAERLFADNYRSSILLGDSMGRAAAAAAAEVVHTGDRVEGSGASEDVQSNMLGGGDPPCHRSAGLAAGSSWEDSPSAGTAAGAGTGPAVSMAPGANRSQQGGCGGEVGSGSRGGTGHASLTGLTAPGVVPCLSGGLASRVHLPQPQPSTEVQGGRQLSADSPASDSAGGGDGCQPQEVSTAAPQQPSHKRQRACSLGRS